MSDDPAAERSEGASRRSVVLVTGMSGTGKSTVLAELKRRGHRVIDTDDPGWILETHTPGGLEPVWDLDQIKALIDDHRTGSLFIAGCVTNQGAVYDRVDAVVLLSAPLDHPRSGRRPRQPVRICGRRPDKDRQRPRGV